MNKRCCKCKTIKDTNDFNKNRATPDGLNRACKICVKNYRDSHKEQIKKYATEHKDTIMRNHRNNCLLKYYGITTEQRNKMILDQRYKCASCETDLRQLPPKSVTVDHDHKTGTVRGILCMRCNTALGLMFENSELIQKLKEYALRIK